MPGFKSLNCYFNKIYPLIDLVINKPTLSEIQFQIVKNLTINSIKKEKENPFNACFNNWKRIVYLSHPYAFNSIGYEEDILNITYEDVLLEYKNFKRRKKYLISNNLEIKAEELSFITMVVLSASFELILFVLIFSMLMLIGGIFSTCLPLLSSTPS